MKAENILNHEQKEAYCRQMTELLPLLRARLGMTQEELGNISGVSRVTISQIESGRAKMNWLHFSALMMVCTADRNAKELLYVRGLLDDTLLRFYQVSSDYPQLNVVVPLSIISFLKEYTAD
jgi:DNA-binding XRE family transcriptional regulator